MSEASGAVPGCGCIGCETLRNGEQGMSKRMFKAKLFNFAGLFVAELELPEDTKHCAGIRHNDHAYKWDPLGIFVEVSVEEQNKKMRENAQDFTPRRKEENKG